MESVVQPTLEFISAHSSWAFPVMFITAFGESFAFLSLLFPGTSILIVAGTLMSAGSLPYWPVLLGAVIGAVLGDSVSFWLGHRYGGGIGRIWPFTRNPDLLPNGIRFFQKHGGTSVFIGRFFGPVRAVIPLAAGIMQMRRGRFWFANVTSAIVWASTQTGIKGVSPCSARSRVVRSSSSALSGATSGAGCGSEPPAAAPFAWLAA